MHTVYPNLIVFETLSQVLPSLTVFETILCVLPILNVFETLLEVLPIFAVFETLYNVLPIKNVSEAINHVSPKFLVPPAETETYVLSPKNDRIFAFWGGCGMIEACPPNTCGIASFFVAHGQSNSQPYLRYGAASVGIIVGNTLIRVLVDIPTGAALCRLCSLEGDVHQMTTQDFSPYDLEKKITITLTVRDVLEIMQAARRPEGVALLAVNRALGCLILMIGLEVMAAGERAAVWRYVEQLVAGRGRPVS